MELTELKPIVEAMIFVSEEPLTENGMLLALQDAGIEKSDLKECIAAIEKDWNECPERGIHLAQVAGGYQFRTKGTCADWLRRLNVPKPMRLSGPALETLAIVAYRQPIVRSEIEQIRGVDSGGVLKTLLERRILRIVGKRDEPGQPLLYGTTKDFLEVFNLRTLKELPTLRDLEDLLRERRAQTDSANVVKLDGEDSPPADGEDGDEPTEAIKDIEDEEEEEEEEEETEVIRRYPLDEDEEAESKDMEALSNLESNLKDLRRLERDVFPKPLPQVDAVLTGGEDAGDGEKTGDEKASEQVPAEAAVEPEAATVDEAAAEDASAADDRPVE